MTDYVYAAFIDFGEELRISRYEVVKRTEKRIVIKRGDNGVGYGTHLTSANVSSTPEEAMEKLRALLSQNYDIALENADRAAKRLGLAATMPPVTDPRS